MHSKLASKIKGIIFPERPAPRPTPRDEAQAELISDGAGPSSDGGQSDPSKRSSSTGSKSEQHGGSSKKRKQQHNRNSKSRTPESMTQKEDGNVVGGGQVMLINPRRQRLLRNQPSHDSTQHVHVCDIEVGGASNNEPIRHYMDSCHNTPTRRQLRLSDSSANNDKRILLNVGGVRHETHVSTLGNVPNSRLSRLAEAHVDSGKGKQEYFFDRHPAVFNSIIDFYRTGELHVPLEVCGAVVKRELDFWQIDETDIKACCWRHYRHYIENERILGSFSRSLEQEQTTVDLSGYTGWRLWQAKIWLVLDHPRTSRPALVYGIVSFLFVTASIAGFCLETLPNLRPQVYYDNSSVSMNITCGGEEGESEDGRKMSVVLTSNKALSIVDIICTIFFTGELILRFLVSPGKWAFVRNIMNIIDLLALVPLYVQMILDHSTRQACFINERFVIEIMFILRIFRMFRVFHLVKHYQALKVLVYALNASLQELMMLFIFLLIGMLIFSTMIYYAERTDSQDSESRFSTIPVGFWWAIITMTTVGYGDVTPKTPIGYVVGTACSICGVLLIALTIPVISNNFGLFYEHVRSRQNPPPKKTDREGGAAVDAASFADNDDDDDDEDDDLPVFPPDYGSIAFKMQTLSNDSKANSAAARDPSHDYNRMNGQAKEGAVPRVQYADTSSVHNTVFQEGGDDLLQNVPSSPFPNYGKLKFMDTDSSDRKDSSSPDL